MSILPSQEKWVEEIQNLIKSENPNDNPKNINKKFLLSEFPQKTYEDNSKKIYEVYYIGTGVNQLYELHFDKTRNKYTSINEKSKPNWLSKGGKKQKRSRRKMTKRRSTKRRATRRR